MVLTPPDNAIPAVMVIPAGRFLLGGIEEDKFVTEVELPPVEVAFSSPFALGVTPVTRRQWREVMGSLPSENLPELSDDCPVVGVTYSDCLMYLRELSSLGSCRMRLPSESEWEYACRSGSRTVFPHGNSLNTSDANYLYDEFGVSIGSGELSPVGRYPANSFGLRDLLGNVCEWTADLWTPSHHKVPQDGSARTSGGKAKHRTIRGGAWDHLPRVLRASWRDWAPENASWDNLGFRIAYDL